jgi:ABC-2 type transport system permease protein
VHLPLLAIARRDLGHYFSTPLAWLVLAVWLALTSFVFYQFGLVPAREQGSTVPLFVGAQSTGIWLLLVLAPAITMGAFAGERQQQSLPLLFACPVPDWQIVVGKFLASWGMLLSLVAASLVQVVALWFISDPGGVQLLGGYLGLVLYVAVLAAIGNGISLLVESPMAAYVLSFGALFVLQLFSILANLDDPVLGQLGWLFGIGIRVRACIEGDLRLGHITWLLAACGIGLLATHTALRARRLHG